MSVIPTISTITGIGKPRLLLLKASGKEYYSSLGTTTYTANSVSEADGASATITTSSVANPTLITTSGAHGLTTAHWAKIAGHSGSTPSLNGDWKVESVPLTTTLKIAANVTVGGSGGTIVRTPAFLLRTILPGMRVRGTVVTGSLTETTYAKILSISGNTITVDAWTKGTPTDGQVFYVDGWVADLPRGQRLKQTFIPDKIVHNIYRSKKSSKHYGYLYRAELDYSRYISGDTLLLMMRHLNMTQDDRLVFIPYVDAPNEYNVMMNDPIDLELFGQGLGHRGVTLVFTGTEGVSGLPMSGTGYGYFYATNYGNGL
jgi:hypothetical protein